MPPKTKKVKIICPTCDASSKVCEPFERISSVKPTAKINSLFDKFGTNVTPKNNVEVITYQCTDGHQFEVEQKCR
jgi:hypothetical protein